jgi:hypothetical protein
MTFQREGAVFHGAEAVHASGGVGTVHCVEPGDQRSTSRRLFSADQDRQERGEEILTEFGLAMLSRQRDRLREALRRAGTFLLEERTALPDGSHDPLICTQISARIRTLDFAPRFEWL